MENASFAGEGRTGATSDSPARNGIRRSATPRRRTAPPLRTTGCLNEPESTLPVLAFRLSSPRSARARAHHSELGSPDSTRVSKPIDLCGSFGRITSTLGLLRIFGRHNWLSDFRVRRALAHVRITANLVHQIQAGSASPSTFAVHLEEYLRPLGCSEFPGGTIHMASDSPGNASGTSNG